MGAGDGGLAGRAIRGKRGRAREDAQCGESEYRTSRHGCDGAGNTRVQEPLLLAQLGGDQRMDELRDVSAVDGDLADQRRGDERELLLRREEHGLEVPRQVARHVGQLELELEIRHRAQAAHHDLDIVLARKVHGEAGVTDDLDIGNVGEHAAGLVHPLLDA